MYRFRSRESYSRKLFSLTSGFERLVWSWKAASVLYYCQYVIINPHSPQNPSMKFCIRNVSQLFGLSPHFGFIREAVKRSEMYMLYYSVLNSLQTFKSKTLPT